MPSIMRFEVFSFFLVRASSRLKYCPNLVLWGYFMRTGESFLGGLFRIGDFGGEIREKFIDIAESCFSSGSKAFSFLFSGDSAISFFGMGEIISVIFPLIPVKFGDISNFNGV